MNRKFTHSLIVENIDRLNNSRNGNPRFKFTLSGLPPLHPRLSRGLISMKTPSDAGWVYEVCPDQLIGKRVAATYHITFGGNAVLDGIKREHRK